MQNEQELRDLLYEKMCNEQENFIEKLFENIDENSREIFKRTIENIEINLDNIMEGWK